MCAPYPHRPRPSDEGAPVPNARPATAGRTRPVPPASTRPPPSRGQPPPSLSSEAQKLLYKLTPETARPRFEELVHNTSRCHYKAEKLRRQLNQAKMLSEPLSDDVVHSFEKKAKKGIKHLRAIRKDCKEFENAARKWFRLEYEESTEVWNDAMLLVQGVLDELEADKKAV